jgi:hypothetical protein
MVLVYLKSGACVEVEAAVRAAKSEGELICYARNGSALQSFPLDDVSVFTVDEDTADLLKDEICDEVTTI